MSVSPLMQASCTTASPRPYLLGVYRSAASAKSCRAFVLAAAILALPTVFLGQQPSESQVAKTLQTSLSALSGGTVTSSIEMKGHVDYKAGSLIETGMVRFVADSKGNLRMEVRLPSQEMVETRRLGSRGGEKRGKEMKLEKIAPHNVLRSSAWFSPELYLDDASVGKQRSAAMVPCKANPTHLCVHTFAKQNNNKTPDIVASVSGSDIELDPATMLPVELRYYAHPERSATINIATKIEYSDYQNISGHMAPFHIKKYINGVLNMDITMSSIVFGSQIVQSEFTLQ